VEYLVRVRPAAQADGVIRSKVLVDAGDLVPVLISVCDDLATCAVDFPSQRRTRMTIFLNRLVEVAVAGAIPQALFVEQVTKLRSGYLNDSKMILHEWA
jgi:hypothetical protein